MMFLTILVLLAVSCLALLLIFVTLRCWGSSEGDGLARVAWMPHRNAANQQAEVPMARVLGIRMPSRHETEDAEKSPSWYAP